MGLGMWENFWGDDAEGEDHADLKANADGLVAEAACPCAATAITAISFQQVYAALNGQAPPFTRNQEQLRQLQAQNLVSCAGVSDPKGNVVFVVAFLCRRCGRVATVAEQPYRVQAVYNHGLREYAKAHGGQQMQPTR